MLIIMDCGDHEAVKRALKHTTKEEMGENSDSRETPQGAPSN